jgi:Putative helicase
MTFAKTLERWLKRDPYLSEPEAGALSASTTRGRVTRAPPREGEFCAVDIKDLLARHAALIDRIKVAYGGAEGSFEVQVAPLIGRFAAFVHLLPATRDGYFRHAGGCLHCGLEVGFHALQAADGQIFPARGTVPERRAAAPRWRAAALAMGLCIEVYRPIFGAAVHDEQGAQWNPLVTPLFDWLVQRRCERYCLEWSQAGAPPRSAALAVLPQILGPSLIGFLADPDRSILDHMVAAIAAPAGVGHNALGAIVEQTLSRVVAREVRRGPTHPLAMPTGATAEPPSSEGPANPERSVAPDADEAESASTVSPPDLAMPDRAQARAAEQVLEAEDTSHVAAASAAITESLASAGRPRRRLAIPATLNPVVAEALVSLLAPPSGGSPAAGVEISDEGIYVPLGVWEERGLDTGLVVRSLNDARLLVLQGARKVWRKRRGDEDVPGLMLNARLLA